jgi:MYXO-CTERM domain-containing protein
MEPTMKRSLISGIAALTMALVGLTTQARADLIQTVWHGIPFYQFAPDSNTIDQERAWVNANPAAYSFVNSALTFNYNNSASTIAQYFAADAAGAALMDTSSPSYFAFTATGYIYAPTAGSYTFSLGNTFNQVDDAARVSVNGVMVVQQNFQGGLTPYNASLNLAQGYHSFELFGFQTFGGYDLSFSSSGPGGAAVQYVSSASVPSPGALALLGLGLLGLGALRRKQAV